MMPRCVDGNQPRLAIPPVMLQQKISAIILLLFSAAAERAGWQGVVGCRQHIWASSGGSEVSPR